LAQGEQLAQRIIQACKAYGLLAPVDREIHRALCMTLNSALLSDDTDTDVATPTCCDFSRRWCFDFTHPHEFEQYTEHGRAFNVCADVFQWTMVLLILLNMVFCIPWFAQHAGFLRIALTIISGVLFLAEYLVRVWVCIELPIDGDCRKADWRRRLEFMFCDVFNVLDLMTLFAFGLSMFMRIPPGGAALLRLGRVARVFSRLSRAKKVLAAAAWYWHQLSIAEEEVEKSLELALGIKESAVTPREVTYFLLQPEEHKEEDHRFGSVLHSTACGIQYFIFSLIIINLVITGVSMLGFTIPNWLQMMISLITCVVFTSEFLARVWVCVDDKSSLGQDHCMVRLRFLVRPLSLMDIVSIITLVLTISPSTSSSGNGPSPSAASIARIGRLGRGVKLAYATRGFRGLSRFRGVTRAAKFDGRAAAKSVMKMTKRGDTAMKHVDSGESRSDMDKHAKSSDVESLRQDLAKSLEVVKTLQVQVESLNESVEFLTSTDESPTKKLPATPSSTASKSLLALSSQSFTASCEHPKGFPWGDHQALQFAYGTSNKLVIDL